MMVVGQRERERVDKSVTISLCLSLASSGTGRSGKIRVNFHRSPLSISLLPLSSRFSRLILLAGQKSFSVIDAGLHSRTRNIPFLFTERLHSDLICVSAQTIERLHLQSPTADEQHKQSREIVDFARRQQQQNLIETRKRWSLLSTSVFFSSVHRELDILPSCLT